MITMEDALRMAECLRPAAVRGAHMVWSVQIRQASCREPERLPEMLRVLHTVGLNPHRRGWSPPPYRLEDLFMGRLRRARR